MHLYIRADSDGKIGVGHMMRCIALAQAWQDQGGEVTFISHCESGTLKERVQNEGFRLVALDRGYPDSSDLKDTLAILKRECTDQKHWLVLDGYHFTSEYQKSIRDEGYHVMVIDDMNHLPSYHADILLNQNIHALNQNYHCDADTTLLLGVQYVLLRREFLKYQDFKRQIPERAKNIFVTLGGADPDNVTLKVIEALKLLDEPDISVRIIVGPANPHQESIRRSLVSARFVSEIFVNPTNMPELMVWADMAVSASGSTCWELAFLGVPIVALILADNQKAVAEGMLKEGFAVNLGWHETFDQKIASGEINSLIQLKDRRLSMVRKGQALVCASGRDHLCERLLARSISIRLARESDRELIWNWANDEETRKVSYSQAYISWDEHIKWFASVQRQKNHRFYVARNGYEKPVGQIRFAVDGKHAVVSLSVAPESRGKGYGKEILIEAAKKFFNETDIEQISAYVKSENMLSLKVFQKAGFHLEVAIPVCGVKSCKMILRRPTLS
jgi:UDP-2,4-diacetamido-2,4,6-trideoxy-beta-L-altropyranose hydrolase